MPETRTSPTEISSASAPLLTPQSRRDSFYGEGVRSSTITSILLGLILGRHGASMVVRESAAQELEVSRENWGYSFPVVVINTIWNLAFVLVPIVMLFLTAREKPDVPIRAWICVYALQRVVLVWLEYRRRRNLRAATPASNSSSGRDSIFGYSRTSDETSTPKQLETYNTVFQYLCWLVALCWLFPNFDMQSAPCLFWLTLTLMAVDVFFAVFGCLRGLMIAIAVCSCFEFIIALLFFTGGLGGQGGASEEEIKVLPMYKYQMSNDEQQPEVGGKMVPSETNDPEFSSEHALLLEDVDCCICLRPYEEGRSLSMLPCNHHFHATCLVTWLRGSRTCPLCKYVIPQAIKV